MVHESCKHLKLPIISYDDNSHNSKFAYTSCTLPALCHYDGLWELSSDVPTIHSIDDVLSMHDASNAVIIDADSIIDNLGKDWLVDLGPSSRPVFIVFHGLVPDMNMLAVLAHVCQYPQVRLMCDVMSGNIQSETGIKFISMNDVLQTADTWIGLAHKCNMPLSGFSFEAKELVFTNAVDNIIEFGEPGELLDVLTTARQLLKKL